MWREGPGPPCGLVKHLGLDTEDSRESAEGVRPGRCARSGFFFFMYLIMKHFLHTEECKKQYNGSPLTRHHDETDVNVPTYLKQIS